MKTTAVETLGSLEQKLRMSIPWVEGLLQRLKQDNSTITHIRNQSGPVWFLRIAPPPAIQTGFGTAPELLIIVVDGELQARTLYAAGQEVIDSELRLDSNLLLICDRGTVPLHERLSRMPGNGQRIAWTPDSDARWPELKWILRRLLPTFDAFEERDPVRGSQLIGRESEVTELDTRLKRGDAVGLFGLRKMGKSSLMRAVTDRFDPISGLNMSQGPTTLTSKAKNIALVVDAQVLVDRTVDALADEFLKVLNLRRKQIGDTLLPTSVSGVRGFKSAIETIIDADLDCRLWLAIDEYDLLFEGEDGEPSIPGLNKFFRLIRGWSQMKQGRVSLLLVGRDSTFLSTPELDGVTSALLVWCKPMWIGPLRPEKSSELLRKIGQRVGLSIGPKSVQTALEWTGGHPLLHRQFGSAIREAVRRQTQEWGTPSDDSLESAIELYRERDAVQEVMREVASLLQKRHPDLYTLLLELAAGRELSQALSHVNIRGEEATRRLRQFGLLNDTNSISKTLQWYLTGILPDQRALRKVS